MGLLHMGCKQVHEGCMHSGMQQGLEGREDAVGKKTNHINIPDVQ